MKAHLTEDNLALLIKHMPSMAAVAGWRFCTVCSELRFPTKGGAPKDRREALLRLACPPGSPCRPHSHPSSTLSVADETRARRARKRQREMSDADNRQRRRLLSTPDDSTPPSTEDIMQAKFKPGGVFDKIPQSALHKARKAFLLSITAFNVATPRNSEADFTADDSTEGKEQLTAFLKSYLFPHAVLRRLYPDEEGPATFRRKTQRYTPE